MKTRPASEGGPYIQIPGFPNAYGMRSTMEIFHFRSRLLVPRPRAEVFEFFASALNLEEITPPWLRFKIVSPLPIQMREGTQIEYRLKLRGIPVGWRTRITAWDPPKCFVDEQVSGPYRVWIHEHRFMEEEGGTACEDHVQYAPPGGALINSLFVGRDIRKIFAYRSDRLRTILGATPREP
jgi:ligand-binding SRPBCC domain-containing protein